MGEVMTLKRAAELCAKEYVVTLQDGSNNVFEEKIWIRTQTDPEKQEAELALSNRRKELKTKYAEGSEYYDEFISEIERYSNELLALLLVQSERMDIQQKAKRSLPKPMPFDISKERTRAQQEKAEDDYQKRTDEYEKKLDDEVERMKSEREGQLADLPNKDLIVMAIKPAVWNRIDNELAKLDLAHQIFNCIRQAADHTLPYYDSVEEVLGQPESIKEVLLAAIAEVDTVRPIDIKNLQGKSVMQIGLAADTQEVIPDHSMKDSPESK